MKNAVVSEWKLLIFSSGFYVGILLVMAGGLLGGGSLILSIRGGMDLGDNVIFFTVAQEAMASDLFCMMMPIACVLSGATSFMEDMHSRFLWYRCLRSQKKPYLFSKVLTALLSGGVVAVIGSLFIFIICLALFWPDAGQWKLFQEYREVYFRLMVGNIGLACFNGTFWVLVGAVVSIITNSKYMAYASPFIIYYVWTTLLDSYFPEMYMLNPGEWEAPQRLAIWICILIFAILDSVMAVIYYKTMERRLKDG